MVPYTTFLVSCHPSQLVKWDTLTKEHCLYQRENMNTQKEIPVYGEVCLRKKQRRKRQKLLLIELFLDFAKNTTLHGLRYVAERGLTIIEKLFWLATFLISVSMCFYQISIVWDKWRTSPVIVSFSEQFIPVGMVPFPSVTICPQIKVKASIYNYSEEYMTFMHTIMPMIKNRSSLDDEKINHVRKLSGISLLCDPSALQSETLLDAFLEKPLNSSVVEDLLEVAPTSSDVFLACQWRTKNFDCVKIFKKVLTSEGVCFNFNALAAEEIFRTENIQQEYKYVTTKTLTKGYTVEDGYDNKFREYYPRRGRENGAAPDLNVFLRESIDDRDPLCNSLSNGFKIYVQHPADLPQDSLYYYAALPEQVSSLALKFNMLSTSKNLKGYDPEIRQCYFPGDRTLRYFKVYSQSNCRYECQSNFTFNVCGCVMYNMPHYDSRSICNIRKSSCILEAKELLATEEMVRDLTNIFGDCRCLPACNSVQYDAEILKTSFNLKSFLKANQEVYDFEYDFDKFNYSRIELYFKEPRFVSMRRSELFGLTDFLANCGGLLGLFLGFSFLSFVEIIYFVSLRLCCTLRRDLKEEKAQKAEKLDEKEP